MKMNKYVENTDLSLLEQFVKEHGVIKSFAKKKYSWDRVVNLFIWDLWQREHFDILEQTKRK